MVGDEVLENKIRRMVFNHITKYPGVSFNTLKDIYELTDNSLRYHLYYLEKNDMISSSPEKGLRRYYPHPGSVTVQLNPQSSFEARRLSSEQEHILGIIMRNPRINQKELIQRSKMNRFKVIREINNLKKLNLVKNTRGKNRVCYEYIPDVEMKYRILKGLMVKFLKNEIDEQMFLRLKKRFE
jgi:predicted transcriptional regulator